MFKRLINVLIFLTFLLSIEVYAKVIPMFETNCLNLLNACYSNDSNDKTLKTPSKENCEKPWHKNERFLQVCRYEPYWIEVNNVPIDKKKKDYVYGPLTWKHDPGLIPNYVLKNLSSDEVEELKTFYARERLCFKSVADFNFKQLPFQYKYNLIEDTFIDISYLSLINNDIKNSSLSLLIQKYKECAYDESIKVEVPETKTSPISGFFSSQGKNREGSIIKEVDIPDENIETVRIKENIIHNDVLNEFAYEDCIAKADINYNYMSPIRLPYDLEECYLIGYAIEDKKLNEIYKELMSKLSEKDKKELRAKQRQWIKERDKKVRDLSVVLDRPYRKTQFLRTQIRYEIVKHRVDELVELNKQIDADD